MNLDGVVYEIVASHPVMVGVVPWPVARATLVVKTTMRFFRSGLALAEPADLAPLCLDGAPLAHGLHHPSDFAPYKPFCDVFLLAERETSDAGRLRVAVLDLAIEPGASLAARPTAMPGGDPLAAPEVWAVPGADLSALQVAPPERQIPHPNGPFAIDVRRGPARVAGQFEGPFVRATVASADGGRVVARVEMALDAIGIDLRRGRVELCFRGVFPRVPDPPQQAIVVELLDGFRGAYPGAEWEVADAIALERPPGSAGSTGATVGTSMDLHDELTNTAVVPASVLRAPMPPRADTVELSAIDGGSRLPFGTGGTGGAESSSARERFDPSEFAALRAAASQLVVPAAAALDGTIAIQAAHAAGTHPLWQGSSSVADEPTAPPPTPPPPERLEPPRAVSSSPVAVSPIAVSPVAVSPVAVSPVAVSPIAVPPGVAGRVPADDPEARLRAVQREAWRGERPLREVLADHGVSLDAWRAFAARDRAG